MSSGHFHMALLICLLQIDADDVITREEQIYVLIGAHAKCERSIQAQISLLRGLCLFFIKSCNVYGLSFS